MRILIYIVNFILGVIQFLIGIRIVLQLFNANEEAPFVQWIFENSAPLLEPFANIFPVIQLDGRFELDLTALFAIFIYSIAGYFLMQIIGMIGGGRRR
ncbi:YggT family protein [Evansella clarkii]|jgi:uncharacterized protein YggT (Ycf19 family)|uniref:YggT family protein n=1 Tax=Evansella clarkii TaxID=79879 RepID=UPI000B44E697|nr:YggT family protein [Evansella clarkii]